MCRKLLALVALLGFVSIASAAIPIDDFEAYWGTPALQMVWTDTDGAPSTNTAILLTSGVSPITPPPLGAQAMEWDYMVAGGWTQPGNPTDYSSYDHAMLGRNFAALDFQTGGSFELDLRPYAQDLDKTQWYLLEYGGDAYGQTWIPTASWAMGTGVWWLPHALPAIIAPAGWSFVMQPWYANDLSNVPVIHVGQWGHVVITENMYVPWGGSLVGFNAMTSMGLGVWSYGGDTTQAPKIDGTDTVYPNGSIAGRLDVDNIFYIPEPATVALLGLGGLALLRKRS